MLAVTDDQTVDEGQPLDLTGNGNPILGLFVDNGTLDTHTATVDWGDGSGVRHATVVERSGRLGCRSWLPHLRRRWHLHRQSHSSPTTTAA